MELGLGFGMRVAELGWEMGDEVKPNVLLVELADGWPGEWEPEGNGAGLRDGEDQNLDVDCAGTVPSSTSPLFDVVVVWLVPEPLHIRGAPFPLSEYSLGDGGNTCIFPPHSLPLAAAC